MRRGPAPAVQVPMTPVDTFLVRARSRLLRQQALVWAFRGAAVAAAGILLGQLAARRWPPDPAWGPLAASLCVALVIASAGWLEGRPSLFQVARLADVRLGGQDRLTTALELAGADGAAGTRPLVRLQRDDAAAWAARTEPAAVAPRGWPWRPMAVAAGCAAGAVVLAVLPNAAVARAERERAEQALLDEARQETGAVRQEAEAGGARRDASHQALVRELRKAEEALRSADNSPHAVAALSRAQENLRQLVDPNMAGRLGAAGAAGAALSSSPSAAKAASAMANAGRSRQEVAADLAAALSTMSPAEQPAVADRLRHAADAATDPGSAEQLRQAAAAVAAGDMAQAASAMAAATGASESGGAQAGAEFDQLAAGLPQLSAADQAALAQALQKAAGAATSDPQLGDQLQKAGDALAAGRLDDAAGALKSIGAIEDSVGAERQASADASRAANRLQDVKDSLLQPSSPTAPAGATPGQAQGKAPAPAPAQTPGSTPGAGAAPGSGAGAGAGDGTGKGKGAGGQGQGSGQGNGGLDKLSGGPGLPGEQVYIPGLFGPGRALDLPGSTGPGADSALVPYESVYAQYQAAAQSEVGRELIPEYLRDLLRRYFGQ